MTTETERKPNLLSERTLVSDGWDWLSEYIPSIVIEYGMGIVPFQAEGLLGGYPFYYRDRGGVARLSISAPGNNPVSTNERLYTAYIDTQEFEGARTFAENLVYLVSHLERAPFLYRFPGKALHFEKDGEGGFEVFTLDTDENYWGWGNSPEEAFESSKETSAYLTENGIDEATQRHMWELREMQPVSTNSDEREFPEEQPTFEVNLPESFFGSDGKVKDPNDWT